MRYVAAIDQSTTGTKAMLFDEKARPVCRANRTHHQYHPRPGWVEQDASEIFGQTCEALAEALARVDAANVEALAITSPTGAFVVWDKATGEPVHHIIGWQCARGADFCARLTPEQAELVLERSGTIPSGYLPAAKLAWMFENIDGLRERAEAGEVLFGTIETWLVWKLTGGATFASDYCNASITQLFCQKTLDWDDDLLALFDVPRQMLPALYNADADFGTVAVEGLPALPITGVIGDSAAALFGQRCFDKGDVKITYGTGSSILMNLGDAAVPPAPGTTTSVGWRMGDGEVTYVWEGTANYTGAAVAWLVNDLELIPTAAASQEVAAQVDDAGGVFMVPAFSGLGAPYYDDSCRACILGMRTGTKRAHVVRAALDCIGYQVADLAFSMEQAAGEKISRVMA
ncbi:MAG: glycerol kinase, partial [Atopobiaceae bacterium]|nr:glycerol kinase [Atopobiaceae bacterium]